MVHRVGRKACSRIGMAAAALNPRHWDVRRRGHAGRGFAIVTARAVCVGRRMGEFSTGPAGEARGRARVTGNAIGAVGRHVASERCGAHRALRTLTGVGTVVAGVAPAGADRSMVHRIGGEARCRVVVAVAALNTCHRDMRRRLHAGRRRAVVATRAVGVGRSVGKCSARPTREGRGRGGMTGFAISPVSRHMAGQRCRAHRALGTLTGVGTVMAGVAPAGADRGMVHRVDDEACCRIVVAVAALNTCHRDMRWRLHAGRRRAVVAARAVGVGRSVGKCST